MNKATRSVIRLLARHSDWRAEEIDAALQREVYADATRWHWLLRLLLPALGLGFLASGILFFFAYNWAEIPKFGKLSLAGLAVVLPIVLGLIPRLSDLTRKYLVTTAAFLVGPFFGVFGQIYQTGANTYDLFFVWVVFIAVWVVAVDFAPLWLLFVGLLNVTLSLYAGQVAGDWSYGTTLMFHFGLNALATLAVLARNYFDPGNAYPNWFSNVLALAAAGCATVACSVAISIGYPGENPLVCLPPTLVVYAGASVYAFNTKQIYYLVLLAFSLIVIGVAFIVGDNGDSGSLFLAALWVMLTVSASIYALNHLRKKWRHD